MNRFLLQKPLLLELILAMSIILFGIALSTSHVFASEVQAQSTAHMVGASNTVAYYAVGIDGGGPLYKYDVNTQKSKKIASGKWLWLNIKGNRLYLAKNKYGGSDGRNYIIYSMKTNGKSKKKLADGSHPVVKGKYIYYFALKKDKQDGYTRDDKVIGLYRMKLDGKGKKELVAFSKNAYPSVASDLAVSGKKVYYKYKGKRYVYNTSTGKKSRYKGKFFSNIGSYNYDKGTVRKAKTGTTVYSAVDEELSIYNNGAKVTTIDFQGNIRKTIASGKHLMVFIHYPEGGYDEKYAVYMMRSDGSNKMKVKSGWLVSGGEDY